MTGLSFVLMTMPALIVGDLPPSPAPIRVKAEPPTRAVDPAVEHALRVEAWEQERKVFETTPDDAEARDRFRKSLRRMNWAMRLRDPHYRQFVSSLKPKEALDLYVEVLEKLGATFPDRARVAPTMLFRFGQEELDKSLGESEFIETHFPNASAAKLEEFRRRLRSRTAKTSTIADARDAVYELTRDASRDYGLTSPTAIVLEFLCGACRRVDDYSEFVYPQPDEATPPDGASVIDAVMLPGKAGLGYLRIVRFRESTANELDDAVEQLRMQGLRGLIIDLRGNPGGLLTAATATASRFQSHGIIATTTGQSPEFAERVFTSDSGLRAYDMPLVVLVDRRTMSAAEVVAAAWKESGRATLVGLSTFGKGAVQAAPMPLHAADRPDQPGRSGKLLTTVAQVFAPGKVAVERVGVQPHFTESDPTRQLETAVIKLQETPALRR